MPPEAANNPRKETVMKIAVEISIFDQVVSKVVDYPGTPASQAEVIQWLMNQTDYKWADFEGSSAADRAQYQISSILRMQAR